MNKAALHALMDQAVAETKGPVQIDGEMWMCVPYSMWSQIVFAINPPKQVGR